MEPAENDPRNITRLLQRFDDGDPSAFDDLIPLVYDDLRRIAERRMRDEAEGHTLTTTAVVHEAYLRLHEDLASAGDPPVDLMALDEALQALEAVNERLVRVVEHRFFGGLSMEETAEVMQISLRTAARDWRRARAYLREMLEPGAE